MSRQYLKSLQQRAQRLLQISSQQEEGDELGLQQQGGRSRRRLQLKELVYQDDVRGKSVSGQRLEEYRNTDVELLKRCIALTSENSQLKRKIKGYEEQRGKLLGEVAFLEKQLANYREMLEKVRMAKNGSNRQAFNGLDSSGSPFDGLKKSQMSRGIEEEDNGRDYFSFVNHNNRQQLESSQKSDSLQNGLHSNKDNGFRSKVKYPASINQNSTHRYNSLELKQLQARHRQQISQLQQRLKASIIKRQSLQQQLQKQRQKCSKLIQFINREIPKLRDQILKLTSRVDVRVEELVLRDFNQEERRQGLRGR